MIRDDEFCKILRDTPYAPLRECKKNTINQILIKKLAFKTVYNLCDKSFVSH